LDNRRSIFIYICKDHQCYYSQVGQEIGTIISTNDFRKGVFAFCFDIGCE